MKKICKRVLVFATAIAIACICISNCVYAHSGRTDANGGHRDNKNASGLGSYHYHCGGYPAHLHENGVCPYKSDSVSSTTSSDTTTKASSDTSTSSAKSVDTTVKTNSEVKVTSVKIDDVDLEVKVGDTIRLTAQVLPDDVNNKSLNWSSSDTSIASIGTVSGELIAKKSGEVEITASVLGGIKDSVTVVVVDEEKAEAVIDDDTEKNSSNNETITSNTFGNFIIVLVIGYVVLGGVGGIFYFKNKKVHK